MLILGMMLGLRGLRGGEAGLGVDAEEVEDLDEVVGIGPELGRGVSEARGRGVLEARGRVVNGAVDMVGIAQVGAEAAMVVTEEVVGVAAAMEATVEVEEAGVDTVEVEEVDMVVLAETQRQWPRTRLGSLVDTWAGVSSRVVVN